MKRIISACLEQTIRFDTYNDADPKLDMKKYFVFIYSANHAQVYDKSNISGGTAEEFCTFIEEKTGKNVIKGI